MPDPGFVEWLKPANALRPARPACANSGYVEADHFAGAGKMIAIGSGSLRKGP